MAGAQRIGALALEEIGHDRLSRETGFFGRCDSGRLTRGYRARLGLDGKGDRGEGDRLLDGNQAKKAPVRAGDFKTQPVKLAAEVHELRGGDSTK